mmetsp:Transcript_15979/g.19447  ORF Transcript_15979/g.19447 Transcript_15979/m.19447 type:complete len:212 (-) Transcript_15979:96-731(-)
MPPPPPPPIPAGVFPSPPRLDRKNNPPKRTAGNTKLFARSPRPLAASFAGSTVTSTLCCVKVSSKLGSLGNEPICSLVPSVSTPKSLVPSAENVTFSTRSAFTSLKKSEYRTSAGPPLLATITGRSDAVEGATSIAGASEVDAISNASIGGGIPSMSIDMNLAFFDLLITDPIRLLLGAVKLNAFDLSQTEERAIDTSAVVENFMLITLYL